MQGMPTAVRPSMLHQGIGQRTGYRPAMLLDFALHARGQIFDGLKVQREDVDAQIGLPRIIPCSFDECFQTQQAKAG